MIGSAKLHNDLYYLENAPLTDRQSLVSRVAPSSVSDVREIMSVGYSPTQKGYRCYCPRTQKCLSHLMLHSSKTRIFFAPTALQREKLIKLVEIPHPFAELFQTHLLPILTLSWLILKLNPIPKNILPCQKQRKSQHLEMGYVSTQDG